MTIPDLFKTAGESGFREWETRILGQLGKESGLVIATGGGCVTRSENYPLLHQNGHIVWIQRDIQVLPTDGRPLSQCSQLDQMYRIRKPLYEAFSDLQIENNCTPDDAVLQILEMEEFL